MIFAAVVFNAQEFQGKAEYFSKRILKNGGKGFGVKQNDDAELKKAYNEALQIASEKMFILTFNQKEALYEKQQYLEKPKPESDDVSVTISFSGEGKKYINLKDQTKITEDDILGKEFLIVEKLIPLDWKLINETKKIGDYNCYKAELIIPVSEKDKKEYEEYLSKQQAKTSFFTKEEPKDKKIIAWYTPEIPVSVGPASYWGLPGLILELNDEVAITLCSKVTLSNKGNTPIRVPNTGRVVTQEEFDIFHKDKMESLER